MIVQIDMHRLRCQLRVEPCFGNLVLFSFLDTQCISSRFEIESMNQLLALLPACSHACAASVILPTIVPAYGLLGSSCCSTVLYCENQKLPQQET